MRPFVWNADMGAVATLDAAVQRQLGEGRENRFYGVAFGMFAVGVWVRRKVATTKTETARNPAREG